MLGCVSSLKGGLHVQRFDTHTNREIDVSLAVNRHPPTAKHCMRLLLIEDDLQAAEYLIKALREHNYDVVHSADGPDGLAKATSQRFDVIVADRQLPHLDGLSIITQLRARNDRTPVLILSALGTVDDRVHGLKAGGDDYLTKPFAFAELLARIEALARRASPAAQEVTRLSYADLELDLLTRRVTREGRSIDLTAKEFQLLEYFMRRPEQVITRTMLLEGVWNLHFDPQTNIIDVHMSRLRNSVDKGFSKQLIHTVRGAGYVLRDAQQ
jgi:two-component system OmpR family response regulator